MSTPTPPLQQIIVAIVYDTTLVVSTYTRIEIYAFEQIWPMVFMFNVYFEYLKQ